MSILNQGLVAESVPFLEDAERQHPWHPQVLSNLGAAYAMLGDYPRAEAKLEEALVLFPHFEDVRMNLTEVRMASNQFLEAREAIAYWQVHTGNPRFDDYYKKISHLLDSIAVDR
ncbi:MAG: tetratricopeptide repeat protein [Bacteroidia bacterium]